VIHQTLEGGGDSIYGTSGLGVHDLGRVRGPFGDDLDAVAHRLDEAVAARDEDYSRTATAIPR
jgi:hypothetical protein